MKKLFLLFALLSAMSANAYDYIPMLTNGKSWIINTTNFLLGGPDRYVIYTVTGDTLVNGRQCKKVFVDNQRYDVQYTIPAYEENKKIYSYINEYGNESVLMLDFNKQVGDYRYSDIKEDWNEKVTKVDYITVNGITRKRIVFEPIGDETAIWVEGVGGNYDCFSSMMPLPTDGTMYEFLECRENGTVIFSKSDFDITLSVGHVNSDIKESNSKIYSQDGMRLSKMPDKGIYIKDGKKIAR